MSGSFDLHCRLDMLRLSIEMRLLLLMMDRISNILRTFQPGLWQTVRGFLSFTDVQSGSMLDGISRAVSLRANAGHGSHVQEMQACSLVGLLFKLASGTELRLAYYFEF